MPRCRSGVSQLDLADECLLCVGCFLPPRPPPNSDSQPEFNWNDNPGAFEDVYETRVMTLNYYAAMSFWLLVAPVSLCCEWSMGAIPVLADPSDPRNLWTAGAYLILIAIGLYALSLPARARARLPLAGGLALLGITFAPASNIFFTVGFSVAERVLYLPSMGYCVLLTTLLGAGLDAASTASPPSSAEAEADADAAKGTKKKKKQKKQSTGDRTAALLILCALFALRTVARNNDWATGEALWTSASEVAPNHAKAWSALAGGWNGHDNHTITTRWQRARCTGSCMACSLPHLLAAHSLTLLALLAARLLVARAHTAHTLTHCLPCACCRLHHHTHGHARQPAARVGVKAPAGHRVLRESHGMPGHQLRRPVQQCSHERTWAWAWANGASWGGRRGHVAWLCVCVCV
jgi:hypothetical protein